MARSSCFGDLVHIRFRTYWKMTSGVGGTCPRCTRTLLMGPGISDGSLEYPSVTVGQYLTGFVDGNAFHAVSHTMPISKCCHVFISISMRKGYRTPRATIIVRRPIASELIGGTGETAMLLSLPQDQEVSEEVMLEVVQLCNPKMVAILEERSEMQSEGYRSSYFRSGAVD